jgi:hypothetical protein
MDGRGGLHLHNRIRRLSAHLTNDVQFLFTLCECKRV